MWRKRRSDRVTIPGGPQINIREIWENLKEKTAQLAACVVIAIMVTLPVTKLMKLLYYLIFVSRYYWPDFDERVVFDNDWTTWIPIGIGIGAFYSRYVSPKGPDDL